MLVRAGTLQGMEPAAVFPGPDTWPESDDIMMTWGDFTPDIVLAGYRSGLFFMARPDWPTGLVEWWSPLERGVLPLARFKVSRSLRKSNHRYRVTLDQAFSKVLHRCADPSRPGGWMSQGIIDLYVNLHHRGLAHSIETWTRDGQLAGGLFGVAVGGLFVGESMFHDPVIGRDASKVALWHLVEWLRSQPEAQHRIVDVQWATPHLQSLGAITIPRADYLARLPAVVALSHPGGPLSVLDYVGTSRECPKDG